MVNSILGECDRNNISTVTGDGIYPENRIDFTPYMERYQCSLDEVTGMINSAFAEITYRIFKAHSRDCILVAEMSRLLSAKGLILQD